MFANKIMFAIKTMFAINAIKKVGAIGSLAAIAMLAALLTLSGCGSSEPSQSADTAVKQQTFKWRLVTTWPKNLPGLGTAPENFVKLVDRMSNGRLQIKVYGAGEIVPALEVFSAVSGGTAEMGHGAAYYWKGKIPASVFFTSIPFGMNAQEMNGWFHYGDGLELWREAYAPFDLIPFAGGNTGVQMGGWFNREINSLADFKGLKMRIPGLGGEVFTGAGGEAVNIPGGELYTSMQTGVIDATEWVGPYNDLAFGFPEVAKYYYTPGWHEPGASLEFIVNKEAFASLPEDLQAIVEVATRAINADMLDEYTARNNRALQQIRDKGVELREFPEDVVEELKKVAWQVYADSAAKDPLFKKVYESYSEFQQGVSAYHKISEEAYYEMRR